MSLKCHREAKDRTTIIIERNFCCIDSLFEQLDSGEEIRQGGALGI